MAFLKPLRLSTRRGRAVASVLSQEEYNIYVETWTHFMEGRSDEYSAPEDRANLHRICMETVIQWRIMMQKMHKPSANIATEYNQAGRRRQTARESLDARRADRIAAKDGGRGTNIAEVAGNSAAQPKIIDVQVESAEKPPGANEQSL